MLTRLLAVAVAVATLLLTGCQTNPTKFVPHGKRDRTPFECPTNCYVPVDPSQPQWVAEYIRVNRGGVFHLWLPPGWEFVEPRITFKIEATANVVKCPSYAAGIVACKVENNADPNVTYGFTIHVRDTSPGAPSAVYDPFVWPK
jgi:hypothetical protein